MSLKRSYDGAMDEEQPKAAVSPFLPMFEEFRKELDEHHDRRERVIKASRDITAASKKMDQQAGELNWYRIRKLNEPIPPLVSKSIKPHEETVRTQCANVSCDLQGLNSFRYARNITGGLQEFMEAVTFQHYLITETLIPYEEACKRVASLGGEHGPITLTPDDYLLGVFDMMGELMRFAVTAMATSGSIPCGQSIGSHTNVEGDKERNAANGGAATVPQRNVLTDMRELRTRLESLEIDQLSPLGRDVEKKMEVMQTCVAKVENAVYGLIIRGRERPKGWLPDEGANREEVVGY